MDEIEIVTEFIVRSKRERYAGFLGSAKARRKFIDARRGAGPTCYIISTDADLDRTTSDLSDAVNKIFAVVEGTIISCVPGRLAYYEGEAPKNRFILHRTRGAV